MTGLSRSSLELDGDYEHVVCDVIEEQYAEHLRRLWDTRGPFDLVVHCVGVGTGLDETGFARETQTVATNFLSLVQVVETLVPEMIARGSGHLIGLSSIADDGHIAEAPSYCASKAGYSSYLRSLAFYLSKRGVAVTNVRFGFVDTKMAKSKSKPMMITAERAAELLMRCVRRRPIQLTYPKTAGAAMRVLRWLQSLRIWTGRGPR